MEPKVKPWWQSVSLWIAVGTAIVLVIDALVAQGAIPADSKWALIALAIGSILKRGMVEGNAIKAAALVEAAKTDPTKPPA